MYADIYFAIMKKTVCVWTFYLSRDTLVKKQWQAFPTIPSHTLCPLPEISTTTPCSALSGANEVVVIIIAVVDARKELIAGVVKIHD